MPSRREASLGLLAGLTALRAAPAAAGSRRRAAPARGKAAFAEIAKAVSDAMAGNGVVGAAVGVTNGRGLLWSQGFGFTDRSRRTPVTADTLFSVQSISKSYTTTAFMRLVAARTFALDESLHAALPEFTIRSRLGPEEQARISFRDLLSHRAGLPHEAPKGGNFDACDCGLADHIRSVYGTWLKAQVGDHYSYSNVGIDLVGYAMERRLGAPFEQVMRRELLDPLGMNATTFDWLRAKSGASLALGQRDADVPTRRIPIQPSGGMYSTVGDMAKFVRLHLNQGRHEGGRLAPEGLLRAMGEITEPVEFQVNGYGLGLERRMRWGRIIHTHGGGGFGFQTEQRWIPEDDLGVIVLTNYGGDESVAVPLADRTLEIMLRARSAKVEEAPSPVLTRTPVEPADAEALAHLVGSYRGYGAVKSFAARSGALGVQTGDNFTALTTHGPAEFTTATERYRFRLDPFGRPQRIDYRGANGTDVLFPNALASDPSGPNDPAWRAYVGAYEGEAWGVETITTHIELRDGWLYSSRGGGTRLAPYAPDLFFAADGESVVFQGERMWLGNRPFTRKPAAA